MSEDNILSALQKAVTQAIEGKALSADAVKYLGRTFEIPEDGKWLEIVYIPNNVPDEFWADGKTYKGLLRLILHWPLDDKGVYEPVNLLMSISAGLEKGSKFSDGGFDVRIIDHPNLTGVLEQPPEMLFPVSIKYQCFKA